MEKQLCRDCLAEMARRCYNRFAGSATRLDALRSIAGEFKFQFSDYLSASSRNELSETDMAFVELLDQVLFELDDDNALGEQEISEYIIDDLYQRVASYLDLYTDVDRYKRDLRERMLTPDDPVIIRGFGFDEFVPLLITEFHEQSDLRTEILYTLLFMETPDLMGFFYDIAKNDFSIDLKILALLGLKKYNGRFNNWQQLKYQNGAALDALIDYAASGVDVTGAETLMASADADGTNGYIPLFRLCAIELLIRAGTVLPEIEPLLDMIARISIRPFENQQLQQMAHHTVVRLLTRLPVRSFQDMLHNGKSLKSFLMIINSLPVDIFDHIIMLIDRLGDDFITGAERLIAAGEIDLEEDNSSLLGYLVAAGVDTAIY